MGKSQATISRIENGKQSIGIQLLISIAKALEVHPFNLLGSSQIKSITEPTITGCFEQVLIGARISNNYSIKTIARRLNRSKSYIQEIETGSRLPEETDLAHFTRLYNLNTEFLKELFILESLCPKLSMQFAQATDILTRCLKTLKSIEKHGAIQILHYLGDIKILSYIESIPDESEQNLNSVLLDILKTDCKTSEKY